jgi:hypothetical protein
MAAMDPLDDLHRRVKLDPAAGSGNSDKVEIITGS